MNTRVTISLSTRIARRVWVAVVLMIALMLVYVMSDNLSLRPLVVNWHISFSLDAACSKDHAVPASVKTRLTRDIVCVMDI